MTGSIRTTQSLKKKCTICNAWLPRTEEYFYRKIRRGRKYDSNGNLYVSGACKECEKAKLRSRERKHRNDTPEAKERLYEIKKARRAAANRVLDEFEEVFKLYYAQELEKRGLRLQKYRTPELRERATYHREKEENA